MQRVAWFRKRQLTLVTVARDRDSDSEDCYVLVVSFIFLFSFFRPPNFRRSLANFRETLPHDTVCPEKVYIL